MVEAKLSDLEGLKKKEMDYLMDYTMSGVGLYQPNLSDISLSNIFLNNISQAYSSNYLLNITI